MESTLENVKATNDEAAAVEATEPATTEATEPVTATEPVEEKPAD